MSKRIDGQVLNGRKTWLLTPSTYGKTPCQKSSHVSVSRGSNPWSLDSLRRTFRVTMPLDNRAVISCSSVLMALDGERATTVEIWAFTYELRSSLGFISTCRLSRVRSAHMGMRSCSPLKSGRTCKCNICRGSVATGGATMVVLVSVDARDTVDALEGLITLGASPTCAGNVPPLCISRGLCKEK